MKSMMDTLRIVLKIVMWILIIGFGSNAIMQTISYSFYKNAKKMTDISISPQFLQMSDSLTGYGYNLDLDTNQLILYFGGSNYIAYNSVGQLANKYKAPFIAVDYYGTQESTGKMNLSTMKQSAEDLYEWVKIKFPEKDIVIMGHSYGTGIATYLASERECKYLIIAAAYRDLSDLYNKMTPIFWGPMKIFISNNIQAATYAKAVTCPVFIIGSKSDKTLSADLQLKLIDEFSNAEVRIFDTINHEDYFISEEVIKYVQEILEK